MLHFEVRQHQFKFPNQSLPYAQKSVRILQSHVELSIVVSKVELWVNKSLQIWQRSMGYIKLKPRGQV